jgi:hypothetical protein
LSIRSLQHDLRLIVTEPMFYHRLGWACVKSENPCNVACSHLREMDFEPRFYLVNLNLSDAIVFTTAHSLNSN